MPIPNRKPGESADRFMERCMSDPVMVAEYDAEERYAICNAQLDSKKQLNIIGLRSRQRELVVQLRLMARLEATYIARYRRLFERYAREAGKAYIVAGRRGVMVSIDSFKRGLRPILTANILAAATTFGRRTLAEFQRAQKAAGDIFDDSIQAYLQQYGIQKVEQISDTTRDQILAVILEGEAQGLAMATIASNIVEHVGGAIARQRAQSIAITETHSAATYASDKAAEATGLTLEREWLSAEDGRTRPTHVEADGQRRGMHVPFTVGGYSLDRPGDPKAPAEETIRCRCVVLYHES